MEKKTIIAKDEETAGYWQAAQNTKEYIKSISLRIDVAKRNLKKTDREIIQKVRAGAKATIDQLEKEKIIQKEVLKFFESKCEGKLQCT